MTLLLSSLPHISRRAALKLMGIGAGVGFLSYSRLAKPQPAVFNQDVLSLPRALSQSRQVAVVGGGLAGLATAYELSQRGFQVTLLERSPQLGGKIASWPIQVGDESFRMEHGFHGFFPQYYNLWGLVDELDIQANFLSLDFYSVVYRGDRYRPEVFRPSHSAFPWNIVDLAVSSGNRLKWGLNLINQGHWQVFREITGFHPRRSYDRLDQISVADWVQHDFPKGLYDLYFLPFAKSSLNAPDVLSAAELMQFFHFYFFGNPEGLAFRGTRQDMGTSLVAPIAQSILNNGGRILTDTTIRDLRWQDGQIASLTYDRGTQPAVPFWTTVSPVLNQENHPVRYYGAGDEVYAVREDRQEALSLTCTHQGCTVQPQADGSFHCPCHGAVFDADGRVQRGPAKRDLARFRIAQHQADRLQLVAAVPETTVRETLQADYYVFATDVPGLQQIFSRATGDVQPDVQQQVANLTVADPFAVARFWFDRDFPWQNSNFTSLSGYRLTDSITLYHRIQDDYIAWAERTGGSVVELHAYCYKEKEFPTQASLLQTFEQELYEVVPELRGATVLHRELVNQKNFSGYPPGSYADRPETNTPVANLLFAGDWVKMPFPCGLMERAISSGLLAANVILEREGLQRRTLYTVKPQGVLSIFT
ncbi:FAD-dependent oxidoreductase [Thermocoleostomius sinensis]|uniref:FAD-dependent oxidoreductase n=1 Tax=Thermocoleostomius sinensis A174 TaxID=2016057 RepID=A0A9E8ZGS9_9CYAN|nr:FAD-dependent oxidoreductase [Thermocoleostomius sinensis]WAL62481.1 FAD-dependent oxidoreductase [Thermocoleostomius sinensis A174]